MKTIKSMIAILLAGCIALSLTACHGKDEIALTINDTPIKSALYLNALLECDSEAKQRVDEQLAESETTETTEETDYYSQELDGMSYVEYVESKTIDRCKEYVFYQELVDEGKIKLTEEEQTEAETYADYYWNYYSGISTLYEANGVSLETYKKAYIYSYYSNAYFQSLYGEGGEKEVKKSTIKETLTEKYVLVYTLSTSYTDETTDDEKKAAKSTFKNYVSRLEDGEAFKNIYNEYNNITEDADSTETTEDGPKDQYATVLGDEDTSYASEVFADVFDMKKGEVKLIEGEDDSGYTIYVKLDITEDEYYLENLTDSILYILKQEEFDKHVSSKTADFTVDKNAYAINRFKVKKIKYPEATA